MNSLTEMKTTYALAIALVAAALITAAGAQNSPAPFEEQVSRAALIHAAQEPQSKCPLNEAVLERAQPMAIAACFTGGTGWYDAVLRYGEDAARVFGVYGEEPVFARVFDRYGHAVVPVVAYFVENGSTQYRMQEGLSQLWNGDLSLRLPQLSPEQYGLIAIHELDYRGHEMLSEFEIVGGKAKRKQLTRTFLGAKNLVFGGLSDLETVVARGERLPSWSEIGWAVLDLTVVAGGIGATAKVIRLGRLPANAGRFARARAAFTGAYQSLSVVGRAAGVTAAVAIPYVAITRPDLFAGAAGWLAEQAGLPSWLGVFIAYAALSMAIVLIVRLLLGPLPWLAHLAYRAFARLLAAHRRPA